MKKPGSERLCSKHEIVALLSPALGVEKSDQVVSAAIDVLELVPDALTIDDVRRILDALGRGTGLVAIAARLSRHRAPLLSEREDEADPFEADPPPREESRQAGRSSTPADPRSVTLHQDELVALLTPTLGHDKARTLVRETASALGNMPPVLSMGQASRILDRLSSSEGIVGAAASFAKVRLLLRAGSRK